MEGGRFQVVTNEQTHMVVEAEGGRCLGGYGASYYRPWVAPLYTPSGLSVLHEFPHDHPFHNGVFVAQSPVVAGQREANFWALPMPRWPGDEFCTRVGRVDCSEPASAEPHERGVRFTQRAIWRNDGEGPVFDEVRTVDLLAIEDATVCDVVSRRTAAFGRVLCPKTKFGSVGMRVEVRLLPPLGGAVLADAGRRGTAEAVCGGESDFVAYENSLSGGGVFGVFLTVMDEGARGPWFVRDYGLAMYNPTWSHPITLPAGGTWTVSLRVVAYDGPLTDERAARWRGLA